MRLYACTMQDGKCMLSHMNILLVRVRVRVRESHRWKKIPGWWSTALYRPWTRLSCRALLFPFSFPSPFLFRWAYHIGCFG